MNIKLMNKVAKIGTDIFPKDGFTVSETVEAPQAMIVRSASLHEVERNPELLAIARAGAGVNNIPLEDCAKEGVVVFNTPGANANGVKELAVAALILASRDIIGGIEWAKTLKGGDNVAKAVEKGKGAFAGSEIEGKTLGVVGLGAIGGMVANAGKSLGMHVVGCDPYLTVNAAWSLSRGIRKATDYDEIFRTADYISLHVPATESTKNMICKKSLAMMKDGVRIINLSRADLVNAEDIKEAIASGKVASYVSDFPTEETLGVPGIINIPHLGASTAESEDHCAVMAAEQLLDYLTTGNIRNAVNYPAIAIPHTGASRACICHKNIPGVLNALTSVVSDKGINIDNMANGSRGDFAYTIIETASVLAPEASSDFEAIDGVIRVRIL